MPGKFGFYELLQPYFSFGLLVQNSKGKDISNLHAAEAHLGSTLAGASSTLSKIITGILDYLSVEELHTSIGEAIIVYSGTAKFGGEGRANPGPLIKQSLISENGQELSWQDEILKFRLTVPRKSVGAQIEIASLAAGADKTDLEQLNTLLQQFAADGGSTVSDQPGNDFRLELLIKTVEITLPKEDFLPAKVGADGWLEVDPDVDGVVFRFPQLSIVLEQKGEAGNYDLSLKSWDSIGFDDPGDIDTARMFTITPSVFLHSSRTVGFGLEKIVADFSDNITPPEILEQFGTGDDFNGLWIPLLHVFIAPSRTTGFAFSAIGRDLLFDQDKGFSGELELDILRRGGEFVVEPLFYQRNAKAPIAYIRGEIKKPVVPGIKEFTNGDVTIPREGELHLAIRGSISPYTVTVQSGGFVIAPSTPPGAGGANRPYWIIPEEADGVLEIKVIDSGHHNEWIEPVIVRHVTPPGPPLPPPNEYLIQFEANPEGDESVQMVCYNNNEKGYTALIGLKPFQPNAFIKNLGNGDIYKPRNGEIFELTLTPDTRTALLGAQWPVTTPPLEGDIDVDKQQQLIKSSLQSSIVPFKLFFQKNYPNPDDLTTTQVVNRLKSNPDPKLGLARLAIPNTGKLSITTLNASLREFITATQDGIRIYGFASFEDPERPSESASLQSDHNNNLSEIRAEVLAALVNDQLADLGITREVTIHFYSDLADQNDNETTSDADYRVAVAVAHSKVNNKTRQGTLRLLDITAPPTAPPPVEHPPMATEPERPPIFRKLGFRMRMIRNQPVLGEINGELDFNTAEEEAKGFIVAAKPENSDHVSGQLNTDSNASKSGEQGIVDFRLIISYDKPTRKLTQSLILGIDKESADGWVSKSATGKFWDTFGSLMIFAPLLNASIDSAVQADGSEAMTKAIIAGAEVAIATTLGLTGMIRFRKFTLYGIELSTTEILADDAAEDHARFGDLTFILDYAIDFTVNLNLGILTIRSKQKLNPHTNSFEPVPTRVRYRGLGFRINGQAVPTYQPVFDTSKGFELGVAEPGALEVGGPLGPLIRVNSVRVAKQNPLMLEMDLGLNANLGVITIDTVRVRIPIKPTGTPTIIPTGISVNIPGTLVGSGTLDIRDEGFTGTLDITLVPLKLRVQASVGLENLEVGERRLTAFFMGMGVEFPAALPLSGSGLGIYGFLGLFGMHYKRDEDNPVNASLPIALDWFYNKAKGEPHLLTVDGRRTWIAAPDRWSFGVGMVLGTMEGAFVLNLKGMLVLELPGPRILIFVKAAFLKKKPPTGKPAEQTAGILAVVDINFAARYLAIGLIVNYEIRDLLKLEVPVDTRFGFDDQNEWHLYIGSINNKASAEILGIAKGIAYLMFDGKGIPDFPLGELKGFSVAAGIAASLVIGDESSGLYAKVSGALDVGVATAPLHFYGQMKLEGSIHLWFVGLSASARLNVEAPDPLYVEGEVCGSLDLWLTSVSGCVSITIGEPQSLPVPEPLISEMSLQSHSPALLEGQGTDQPIDSSLATTHGSITTSQATLPDNGPAITKMPIDVIPVLQMKYPLVLSASFTGLRPSSFVPTLPPGSDGWFSMGGVPGSPGERELQYVLNELTLSPALPGPALTLPVTWWQPARPEVSEDSQSTDKGANLALNSWIPVPFPRAYQRSQEQVKDLSNRFEVICKQIAPATSVLWTFNAHYIIRTDSLIRIPGDPLPGYSPKGWKLRGVAWPDPAGTQRRSRPNLTLYVHEADYKGRNDKLLLDYAARLTGSLLDPAKVIPPDGTSQNGQALQLPFLKFTESMPDDSLLPQVKEMATKFLEDAGNRERILVESGDAALFRALVCVNIDFKVAEFMILQSFNEQNEVVDNIKLPGRYIAGLNELPANWIDPVGPWLPDVKKVYELLAGEFKGSHNLFLVEYKPTKPITRVALMYEHDEQQFFKKPPPAILGVVEVLTKAETERVVNEQHYQQDMVDVVVKSLEEGDKRPLFAPDTEYTVTAKYTGTVRLSTDHSKSKTENFTQKFKFKTVKTSPKRLDPWMLAMVPENDADSFFIKDKVQFIFNDASAIQIFKAFGKTLKVVLRNANGNHPTENPAITPQVMRPIKGKIKSPYASSMLDIKENMPCIPTLIETESHQVFTLDIPLERQTSYMLDIESTPPPEDALTPLFRTAFTTSRYESAAEFAGIIRSGFVGEKRFRDVLTFSAQTRKMLIPDGTAPDNTRQVDIEIVAEADFEIAWLTAYGSALSPGHKPGISLLWSKDIPSQKIGILIEASESLLRTRVVPVQINTPAPDDDVIQHFQKDKQLYLEVTENGSTVVDRVVYGSSGCRAMLFFKPDVSGSLNLAFKTYRHILMVDDPVSTTIELINIDLPAKAPWEV